MTSVFLSYARADDEEFVARVYTFLQSHGFAVWWDRKNMPARSLAFTEEIRDAIHRSDRFVVVIGPWALRSDYVRAEWQSALSERKPVVTVLRRVPEGSAEPHSCLPPELRIFHAESFLVVKGKDPPLSPLVRLLSDPIPPPPPIFGRPPERPPHFLPRPDAFSAVFSSVLGETIGPQVRAHESRVTVLTGMGGIGKTVLAVSLVEAMRSRPSTFLEDGIYWLAGDPLRRLAAFCHASVADPHDEQAVTDALAKQLDGKRFLLVVDNATSVEQIAPLVRLLGPGGRMLVTTRHGELAVGHQHRQVDQLANDDALRLVADWLGTQSIALPREAQRVVELCGFHPFAIALNAAAASQGLPWSAIVTALERRELDFAEHRFEEYVYATVQQSLKISLDALSKRDRARYRELAAFFWDGGVPAQAIVGFWQRRGRLSEHRGLRLLMFFRQRSLLQIHGSPERYDVRLHDLQLAYIGQDEKKVAALGRALLDSYAPAQRDAWWSVPNDGYLLRHVVRHLVRSRTASDALALMAGEDTEHRNAWYHARVRGDGGIGTGDDGFAGYVADLDLVSGRITHCLLVLIAASLRSLARAVPGELLGAAVVLERYSVPRAIARARLIAEPEKRARAMIALLPQAAERDTWLDETLATIAQSETGNRDVLMRALAPALEESELLPVLRRVVAWVQGASTPYEETHTKPLVWHLLNRVPAPMAAEAVAIADQIAIRPLRLYTLLAEPERTTRISQAIAKLRGLEDQVSIAVHATTVSLLAEYLDPDAASTVIAEALAAVRRLGPGKLRSSALAELLRCLPPDEQRQVLDELIADARANPSEFVELARHAPPVLHSRIRTAVEDQSLAWIAAVAPLLAGDERHALIDLALTRIEASENAASLLWMDDAQLILAMNGEELDRARGVIDTQLDGELRVRALIAVAHAGSAALRTRTLKDAMIAIDAQREAGERERAYDSVAPLLEPAQLAAALSAAERIGEPSGLARLAKLLPHLSTPARRRASEIVAYHARTAGVGECLDALRAIPVGSDIGEAEPLIEFALGLDNDRYRAHLLAGLAKRVKEPQRARVAAHARSEIGQLKQVRARIELLLELGDVNEAEGELERAAPTLDADEFAKTVEAVVRQLATGRAAPWVDAALNRGASGKHVLETIAPCITAEMALAYLARQIRVNDTADRLQILRAGDWSLPVVSDEDSASAAAALARRLGELGRADAAFELVRVGKDDEVTAFALAGLAPWLSRERVLHAERRVLSARLGTVYVPCGIGRHGAGREYLAARLAPALAHVGEVDRALDYAAKASEEWCIAAYLGIVATTRGETRSRTLLRALDALLDEREIYRREHIDDVARAIARDPACAKLAWSAASAWARSRPRNEAIDVLASFAPVAVAVGGTALVDEVFWAIERVVRWWP